MNQFHTGPLIRTKSEEQLYGEMQRGIATARMMDTILPIIETRQKELVHDAIRRYRSIDPAKPYTPEQAMVFVASLVAHQDIVDKLDEIVRDGEKAGQHFVDKT